MTPRIHPIPVEEDASLDFVLTIIGNWRYNSDGINFISCHDCLVENSFIRTFDDSICLKGYEAFGPFVYRLQLLDGQWDGTFTMDGVTRRTFTDLVRSESVYQCPTASIHDIRIRSCVLWNDWGRALELGGLPTGGNGHRPAFARHPPALGFGLFLLPAGVRGLFQQRRVGELPRQPALPERDRGLHPRAAARTGPPGALPVHVGTCRAGWRGLRLLAQSL